MPITPSDIQWYKSLTVADVAANGGRMSSLPSPSSVKNNIFPDITLTERTEGLLRYRKLFVKVANADNTPLQNARAFLQLSTPGEDNVTFFPGTQRDVQGSIAGTERLYGGGRLQANSSPGTVYLAVITEGAALNCFRVGDTVRVTDKSSVSGAGSEEFVGIDAVSYSGDIATLGLASGLLAGYASAATQVSSVYEAGAVAPVVTAPAVTSASGAVSSDEATLFGSSIGSIEQDWTLTFTSSSAFSVVGDTKGNVGAGNTSAGAAPINSAFPGSPFFTLAGAAFSGAFVAGDTVTFTTSPAAIPVWYRQSVPAGAAAISGNRVILGVDGESA